MPCAVIGIGTNIGDRGANIDNALSALSLLPSTRVTAVSHIYETKPVGYDNQADFYNIVCCVETSLSPSALLGACLGIEAALGRVRLFTNGPRIIDLDVLAYEGFESSTQELTVPHPRMGERAFVLCPLEEIYPDGRVLGFDFSRQIKSVERDGVIRTDIAPEVKR